MISRNTPIAIHQLMNKFEKGDMALLQHVSDDIDMSIEHYKDDADVVWQQCKDKEGFMSLLGRLSEEVFPNGTKIITLSSEDMGNGWYTTQFSQVFWYGLMKQDVTGRSIIISHEENDAVDYFRETVLSVEPV
jgi:hypothetical protein